MDLVYSKTKISCWHRIQCGVAALVFAWVFAHQPTLAAQITEPVSSRQTGISSQDEKFPAFSVQISGPDEHTPGLTISVVIVPKEGEKKVLNDLVNASVRTGTKADPLFIIDNERGEVQKELGARLSGTSKIKLFKMPEPRRSSPSASYQNWYIRRAIAADTTDKFGVLVTAVNTAAFSTGWFVTSGAAVGTKALVATAIIQTINNLFPDYVWGAMKKGGAVTEGITKKVAPNSQTAATLSESIGEVSVAYFKNILETTGFFAVKEGVPQTLKKLLTSGGLISLLRIATSGMFANNMWDFAFNRWKANNEVSEQTIRLMNYAKTFFLAVIGVLAFYPPTTLIACKIQVIFGLIGLVAAFYGPSMMSMATRLLEKLTNASVFRLVGNRLKEVFDTVPAGGNGFEFAH